MKAAFYLLPKKGDSAGSGVLQSGCMRRIRMLAIAIPVSFP